MIFCFVFVFFENDVNKSAFIYVHQEANPYEKPQHE